MEVLASMRTLYLERRLKDYSDCLIAIACRKADEIERVGHQIKGNAAPYGFKDLVKIGEELETSARTRDWNRISCSVERLGDFLSRPQ